MIPRKATRPLILQAIERTMREAEDPFATWGVKSCDLRRTAEGDDYGFNHRSESLLASERLEKLRGLL
jgi:hypothetical protein